MHSPISAHWGHSATESASDVRSWARKMARSGRRFMVSVWSVFVNREPMLNVEKGMQISIPLNFTIMCIELRVKIQFI